MKTKQVLAIGVFLLTGVVASAEMENRTWVVDGVTREAQVWIPETILSNGCPLVFAFHGHGGSMQNAARSFRIHEVWPEAMVVYMQGLPTVGQLTDPEGKRNGWNSNPNDPANQDLKFFDAVYDSLADRVDANRVYSTGHSNGGCFTYCLWASRGDRFAAMAPSGAVLREGFSAMKPKPALHIAGQTDPLVKYAWQERMIKAVFNLNGCSESGEPWAESGELTGTLYSSVSGTPLVTLIHPGGHKFPKEAPELIARFFKEYVRK
ncbi:MAG: hypothetical protein MUC65_09705 [Pontiellaceae bacterium]|nr:hypothetical protein [Pontiellaceae bacterium]